MSAIRPLSGAKRTYAEILNQGRMDVTDYVRGQGPPPLTYSHQFSSALNFCRSAIAPLVRSPWRYCPFRSMGRSDQGERRDGGVTASSRTAAVQRS